MGNAGCIPVVRPVAWSSIVCAPICKGRSIVRFDGVCIGSSNRKVNAPGVLVCRSKLFALNDQELHRNDASFKFRFSQLTTRATQGVCAGIVVSYDTRWVGLWQRKWAIVYTLFDVNPAMRSVWSLESTSILAVPEELIAEVLQSGLVVRLCALPVLHLDHDVIQHLGVLDKCEKQVFCDPSPRAGLCTASCNLVSRKTLNESTR